MKLPFLKPSVPLKKLIGHASMVFVAATSLTGIFNYGSAKIDEHKQAAVMKTAANCEWTLTNKGTPCTLDEQKALLARQEIDRREWSGLVKAGTGVVLILSAF